MDKVEAYKNELKNYKYYQERTKELMLDLDDLWYELSGVKGIRYDKEMSNSYNESLSEQRRLDLLDQIARKESELDRIGKQVDYVNKIQQMLPQEIGKACIDIYVNGMSFEKVAVDNNLYCAPSTLYYQINRELERVL